MRRHQWRRRCVRKSQRPPVRCRDRRILLIYRSRMWNGAASNTFPKCSLSTEQYSVSQASCTDSRRVLQQLHPPVQSWQPQVLLPSAAMFRRSSAIDGIADQTQLQGSQALSQCFTELSLRKLPGGPIVSSQSPMQS